MARRMSLEKLRDAARQAALEFMDELWPAKIFDTEQYTFDHPYHRSMVLVAAAFRYYQMEWNLDGFNIGEWKWPFDCLKEMHFPGDEPWSVLLRRALELRLEYVGFIPKEV